MFKLISENDHKNLSGFLSKHRQGVNVVGMVESRGYSLLAFSAFKHHTSCFKVVYEHGIQYNIEVNKSDALKQWADCPTDESFTALHFAAYHGNIEVIKILIEMNANYELRNCYGANVLHISA